MFEEIKNYHLPEFVKLCRKEIVKELEQTGWKFWGETDSETGGKSQGEPDSEPELETVKS